VDAIEGGQGSIENAIYMENTMSQRRKGALRKLEEVVLS
jgi:hypothetical protein